MTNECACLTCVMACVNEPGALLPSDLVPIARATKQSVASLVRLCLEPARPYAPMALRPQRANGGADGCIFLEGQRCSIHAVKPFVCREWRHDITPERSRDLTRQVNDAW